MSSTVVVQQFVSGLKSRHANVQNKAAQELLIYVKTELREMSPEELSLFFEVFNDHIFEMIASTDNCEKKGGVLAINCLIGADIVNTTTRISRYFTNLRNLLTSNDVALVEIAARTLVKLACLPGSKGTESFDFEIKRAFEWLSADRHEYRRHAAVLILRELALAMPTYFYQSSKPFFSNIFFAIFDSKPAIRTSACEALRAALIVVADRETTKQSSKPQCYKICFEKMMKGFDVLFVPSEKDKYLTRDDCISGGLMVLNELLRCSNASWEKQYTKLKNLQPELRKHYLQHSDSHFSLVPKLIEKLGVSQSNTDTESTLQKFNSFRIHESESCRQILLTHYREFGKVVMENRTSRSVYVQQAIALLLPRLAALNKQIFVKEYLPLMVPYLLRGPKRNDKFSSHVTLGLVAVAIENDIERYMKPIMDTIKVCFPVKEPGSKKKSNIDPAVFTCITLLSFAVKSKITEDIKEILDQMLASGLSPALIVCLRELSENIPLLKAPISKGVINVLPYILMDKIPYHYATGMPHGHSLGPKQFLGHENNTNHDIPTIVLALKTLGNFNFDDVNMLDFVQRCADHFIIHDSQDVRLEAVQTCTILLKTAITQSEGENSRALKETVSHVMERLLIVAVTDIDSQVRLRVLRCLDETFDPELAQPESLSALTICLHDEVFEIREIAILTIGRLSSMNVAYIIPSLRKTLIQLLIELEHSGMSRNKEQSARMLDHLIVSTPRLISHYMQPILKILVSKLKETDTNPGVVLNVLRAIGDLAEVNGGSNEMEKWADEILKILLEMLSDLGNPDKRGVALWTLGQIVSATGRVVTPYHKYPDLIDILINFLKTETRKSIRLRTIRVLGLLGAMDPYKHKMNKGLIDSQNDNILISVSDLKDGEKTTDVSTAETLVDIVCFEDYYPAVVLQILNKILKDLTLSHLHTNVVQAITFTCQSLGIKSVRYLPQVIPNILENIRLSEMKDREFLIQQLSNIIEIVKQHIMVYMKDIFTLIKDFWTPNSPLQSTFINLIEKIAIALGCEFRSYFSQLIPQILRVLHHDTSKDRIFTVKMLKALQKFGEILEDYLNLIVPPIVRLFDGPDIPTTVTLAALETIENLAYVLNYTDFASRIIHPLVRVLDQNSDIREQALSTLKAMVVQLGKKFLVFAPLVSKVFAKHKVVDMNYEKLLNNAQEKTSMWLTEEYLIKQARYKQANENAKPSENSNPIKDLMCSEQHLREAFEITPRVSRDDWVEWLKRLSIGLLKQSPSPALRSCKALAQNHDKLLRDLFNAAFISCWQVLSEPQRKDLTHSLVQALEVRDIPEITQTILNLAEFMEHCDKHKLPISTSILGTRAMQCRAYAKALHYKEDEYKEKRDAQVFEALILINTKLQQKEAAEGLLTSCQRTNELKHQGQWYEKLHKYDKAVHHYREQLTDDPTDLDSRVGLMQCLGALGEWSELADIARSEWDTFPADGKNRAARLAAVSTWGLKMWDEMQEYVRCIPEETQDGCFYRAVIAVNNGEYEIAQRLIDETRDLLDTELTSMAGESYERAYGAMVCVQMLTELEEVIQYKLVPDRRETIKKMWWNRLKGGQHSVEDWRRIIQVHTLVLSPQEDKHTWLKYASLCRKNNSLKLSHNTLVMLLETDPKNNPSENLPINKPDVSYAYTKHMAKEGDLTAAYAKLSSFVTYYESQFNSALEMNKEDKRILARCYMRMGRWQNSICGINDPESIDNILENYQKATTLDDSWYKAWHHWAYTNFSILQEKKQRLVDMNVPVFNPDPIVGSYAISAVEGFYHSIHLSKGSSLQDTLRLLTIWFDYGENIPVYNALLMCIKKIEIENWLQVIPQLIARIDTTRQLVRELVYELLRDIGKFHPQALVYPLTVASKSASVNRKNGADKILSSMRNHSSTLVEQAIMCSDELIRVAILWHEQWHEGLEEASRLYFTENNWKAMFDALEPLHLMLDRGPQTLKETSFAQAYGRELKDARDWCERFRNTNQKKDIDQAWDIYYHVFRRISKQLPQLTSLELPYVSPKLMECRDLELAVPGSYNPGKELIKISYIQKNLVVITSKQRPRKLHIHGSNGKDYIFLLKGHEDLRQDERVMQLFGLVNTLLQNDPETFRRNLTIQRYAVIPLSTNSGLIGWVPHCDTLHTLIRDYRDRDKKIYLNQEHRLMLKKAPDYDHLTLMQKVETFEAALDQTSGDDLEKLLWLKSPSSEVWFERRTNYTRSLAVMSMVGYILGLGDRHPSNLMLDRMSGKILHIDFGDCFEVAMTREKFPEKIPFRLTRMLINAMEVTGIEGTYRKTCESVMTVLRHNKDSLMAVLEAFVYDPLLNWRLVDPLEKMIRNRIANQSLDQASNAENEEFNFPSAYGQPSSAVEFSIHVEVTNKKAKSIVERVHNKLTGYDFGTTKPVDVQRQVDLLIQQATNNENLCQCYIGWCPFW